jgi:predicted tellurium resistance membrane protein TerC
MKKLKDKKIYMKTIYIYVLLVIGFTLIGHAFNFPRLNLCQTIELWFGCIILITSGFCCSL